MRPRRKSSPLVLALDPGFANFGYAVVALGASAEEDLVLELGTILTKKEVGKQPLFVASDDFRRTREIARGLLVLFRRYPNIATVCAESFATAPKGTDSSAKVGRAWGIIGGLVEALDLPFLEAHAQRCKKAVCGSASASKEEVQEALSRRYSLNGRWPKTKKEREQAGDALSAFVACSRSEVVSLLRQSLRKRVGEEVQPGYNERFYLLAGGRAKR